MENGGQGLSRREVALFERGQLYGRLDAWEDVAAELDAGATEETLRETAGEKIRELATALAER